MELLPGERARVRAASWLLWGYLLFALLGIILHFVHGYFYHNPVILLYIVLTLGYGAAAGVGLLRLNKSLVQAMLFFIWPSFFCITGILVHDVIEQRGYTSLIPMYYVGIVSVGLILGFKHSLRLAMATSLVLGAVGFSQHWALAVLYVALAYALAMPGKVIEELIQESTLELARVNAELREEITERQRAQTQLQKHHEHLEVLVAVRTAELAQVNVQLLDEVNERRQAEEILRQQAVELAARNEELDAFAHTVAHDLKSPLGMLVGFCEILEKRYTEIPAGRRQEYLGFIAQSGRKVSNIIDELLMLASIRNVEDVPLTLVKMDEIVAEVQRRLADIIVESNVEISQPEAWPAALGYGPWVEEILVNYVSNAIKYGGQPPRVELGATVQSDGRVRFWVHDNGAGLTPEELTRLFTPFTQLGQVRAKGYGLGLSIVRRIVEKLNGEVCVESEVGRGSTFAFTLRGLPSSPLEAEARSNPP